MENKMKYPYIGINEHGTKVLFFSSNSQNVLLAGDSTALVVGCSYESIKSDFYKNITNEYLQNTYGKVQSPQHAEFIIELAKNAGFEHEDYEDYDIRDNYFYFSGDYLGFTDLADTASSDGEKQITIPLPPKDDIKKWTPDFYDLGKAPKHFDCVCNKCGGKCCTGQCDDWLCVGSIVTWGNKSVKGEVKALSDGLAWIKNEYGNYCSEYVNSLQKPKTPEEELRDDIEYAIHHFEGDKVAGRKWLMSRYDIKKRPQ